ncbi:hypothetical protein [Lederbergia citrea]|uniref:hypothetical protein n=1 Tax=Lederbergia citrea TaxID=2833581 RepID=UPI001BC9E2BC|nr:hypothetical protein [Lederbergia citrea]MBS4179407.1 hypothetical protein [Lederbergia citrea]
MYNIPNYTYPNWYPWRGFPLPAQYMPPHLLRPQSMYPPVDIKKLHQSAQKYQELLNQATLLVNKITTSPGFARNLMDAAQKSNQKKVIELILSTGITIKVKTSFSPDGIKVDLSNAKHEGDCCTIRLALPWYAH